MLIGGGEWELVDRLRKSWHTLLYGVLLNAVSALPLGSRDHPYITSAKELGG